MKKIIFILILLFPFIVSAETIYNSILRDNEVKQLPTEYNIFGCITQNHNPLVPNNHAWDGTCLIGDNAQDGYIEGYTDEIVGLYPFTDDKGSMYFFRGWANNWVQLGAYEQDYYYYWIESINNYKTGTYEECLNEATTPDVHCTELYKIASKGDLMYWRIIRTNGDKSVRLVYAGTKIFDYSDKVTIGASAFNTQEDEIKYAGYTYKENGVEVDSSLKTYIEKWYNDNNNTFKKAILFRT